MNKQNVIDKFIDKLKNKGSILGIVLFGSRATDVNREDSDVDLLVVQKEGFARTVEYSDSLAFEITYTTPGKAIDYWKNNPNDCYWLWENGKVVFDKDGTIINLRKKAQKILDDGKKPLDDIQLKHLRFDANDQIESAKRMAEDDIYTANLILTRKVFKLTELFFDIRQKWTPPPKQIIGGIDKLSKDLAEHLRDFYKPKQDFNKKIELAEKITDIVFENKL
jgi:predicted nucleotidyltransferase